MNRRSFCKQVLATAAVGTVAPQTLAEPMSFTTPWMTCRAIGYRLNRIDVNRALEDFYPGKIMMGVVEYDPLTGCWPNKDVNEDGTVKREALKRVWPDWDV